MNTPPTRKRNYRNTKPSDKAADGWRTLPDGHFSTGICSEPILIAYARAVSLWPLVEDAMTNVLMELIGTDNHEVASEIFHALLAQNTRLPVMKALLQNTQANQGKPETFDEIIDEFTRLNIERNHLVHHYWLTHDNGRVYRCPSNQSMVHAMRYGELVTVESLDTFRDACNALTRRALLLSFRQ